MNRQTDHLDCLDHGSAQHSVVDLCPPPAGYDTPLSCLKRHAKINQRIQKLTVVVISSSLTLLCMHNFCQYWNYRAGVCWRTCPVCSTACSGRWWAEGFSVWHNSLPYPAGILQVHIQRKYTQVHTGNRKLACDCRCISFCIMQLLNQDLCRKDIKNNSYIIH